MRMRRLISACPVTRKLTADGLPVRFSVGRRLAHFRGPNGDQPWGCLPFSMYNSVIVPGSMCEGFRWTGKRCDHPRIIASPRWSIRRRTIPARRRSHVGARQAHLHPRTMGNPLAMVRGVDADGRRRIDHNWAEVGKTGTTLVRAYRDGDRAYLVSITGERALWLKNIRMNHQVTLRFRRQTMRGIARDPRTTWNVKQSITHFAAARIRSTMRRTCFTVKGFRPGIRSSSICRMA